MNDLVEPHAAENLIEGGAVGEVAVDKMEWFGQGLNSAQVAAFELRVVEVIQVIKCPNGMAILQ